MPSLPGEGQRGMRVCVGHLPNIPCKGQRSATASQNLCVSITSVPYNCSAYLALTRCVNQISDRTFVEWKAIGSGNFPCRGRIDLLQYYLPFFRCFCRTKLCIDHKQ